MRSQPKCFWPCLGAWEKGAGAASSQPEIEGGENRSYLQNLCQMNTNKYLNNIATLSRLSSTPRFWAISPLGFEQVLVGNIIPPVHPMALHARFISLLGHATSPPPNLHPSSQRCCSSRTMPFRRSKLKPFLVTLQRVLVIRLLILGGSKNVQHADIAPKQCFFSEQISSRFRLTREKCPWLTS